MNRMYSLIGFICFFLTYGLAQNQTPTCGTSSLSAIPNYDHPGSMLGASIDLSGEKSELQPHWFHFPLRFVIFNDEIREFDADRLAQQVDQLNTVFMGANVSFSLAQLKRHTEADFMVLDTSKEVRLYEQYFRPGMINIYVVPSIADEDNNPNAYLGYTYNPAGEIPLPEHKKDMIVLSFDALYQKTTLAHEMGHFFGLLHTHDTTNGKELVSGKDCLRRGDGICDTPADPDLHGKVYSLSGTDCEYMDPDEDRDPEGNPYHPPVFNIMSYSSDGCRSEFTQGQYWVIERTAVFLRQHLAQLKNGVRQGNETTSGYDFFRNLSMGKQDIIYSDHHSKTVVFSYESSTNWCVRLKNELLHAPVYQSFFSEGGSYNLVAFNVNIERDALQDFLGNETLPAPLMDIFKTELLPEITRYPGVYILDYHQPHNRALAGQYTEVLFAHRGYLKPRELVEQLQRYQDLPKPNRFESISSR